MASLSVPMASAVFYAASTASTTAMGIWQMVARPRWAVSKLAAVVGAPAARKARSRLSVWLALVSTTAAWGSPIASGPLAALTTAARWTRRPMIETAEGAATTVPSRGPMVGSRVPVRSVAAPMTFSVAPRGGSPGLVTSRPGAAPVAARSAAPGRPAFGFKAVRFVVAMVARLVSSGRVAVIRRWVATI